MIAVPTCENRACAAHQNQLDQCHSVRERAVRRSPKPTRSLCQRARRMGRSLKPIIAMFRETPVPLSKADKIYVTTDDSRECAAHQKRQDQFVNARELCTAYQNRQDCCANVRFLCVRLSPKPIIPICQCTRIVCRSPKPTRSTYQLVIFVRALLTQTTMMHVPTRNTRARLTKTSVNF
jgi:hypothetical protein